MTLGGLEPTNMPGFSPSVATAVIPSGVIFMWSGLLANIPSGYVLCDGNNGTPNLLNKFVKSVPNAATDPGATGGSVNHTHTLTGQGNGLVGGFADFVNATGTPNTGSTDGRPPYYEIAFIMKT